jgi:hypothetical protein
MPGALWREPVGGVRGGVETVLPTDRWGPRLVFSERKVQGSRVISCFARGAPSSIACLMTYFFKHPFNEWKLPSCANRRAVPCRWGSLNL